MAEKIYGYAEPSYSTSENENEELIQQAFESMENEQIQTQTRTQAQPQSQPQTVWFQPTVQPIVPQQIQMTGVQTIPLMSYAMSPVVQPQAISTLTTQPWQTVQAQPAQQFETTWLGPKATEEAKTTTYPISSSVITSNAPVSLPSEGETVTVLGETGVLVNKQEIINWSGPLPLNEYPINEDPNPEIIRKKPEQQLSYTQEIAIRYLKPNTPPPPGEIVIEQEKSFVPPPAPPLVIRQQPPRPETPPPLVLREAPPKPFAKIEKKLIRVPGKKIPPPPRKVIIERLPQLPAKPQSIIVERWLPYQEHKRRVIFNRPAESEPYYEKPKNVIIQWEPPNMSINKEYKHLGVVRANPEEYSSKFVDALKRSDELPDFVKSVKPPENMTLASDLPAFERYELEGDLQALSLIDLDKEGLSEYKDLLTGLTGTVTTTATAPPPPQLPQQQLQTQQMYQQIPQPVYYQTIPPAVVPIQLPLIPIQPIQPAQIVQPIPVPVQTIPVKAEQAQEVSEKSSLNEIINETVNSAQLKFKDKIDYEEAKNVIKTLNEKLKRKYDESKTERFLKDINFSKDENYDLKLFKDKLLQNLQFYSQLMF